MNVVPVTLQGALAKLVPMELDHVSALYEAGSKPEIWTYLPEAILTEADMHKFVVDALAACDRGAELPFTIVDQESDKVVGTTRFYDIDRKNRGLEIGWTWLNKSAWRTRINTECKFLLLQHCFETLGTIRVALRTDARNLRSQSAIERIGGVKEGVLRHHRIMPDGYLRDTVYYSILADEWLTVKTKLQNFLDQGGH